MARIRVRGREWFMLERGIIRLAMIMLGILLIVVGLAMRMSVLLLGVNHAPSAGVVHASKIGRSNIRNAA
jgi:hypothetical protein